MSQGDELHLDNKKLRGVSFDAVSKKWRGRLYCLGQHVTLGRFSTALEAAQTHDRAAYYVHGASALTNFGTKLARQDLARRPPSSSETTMAHLRRLRGQLATHTQRCVMSREVLQTRRKAAAAAAGLGSYLPPLPPHTPMIEWSGAEALCAPDGIVMMVKTLVRIGIISAAC